MNDNFKRIVKPTVDPVFVFNAMREDWIAGAADKSFVILGLPLVVLLIMVVFKMDCELQIAVA